MGRRRVPYQILVVENDPNHAALIEAVFARRDRDASVSITRSAQEAIAFLTGSWPDTDWGRARRPDVIVVDFPGPESGGLHFLEWYAAQARLHEIPAIGFASSPDPELEKECLSLGAREFRPKSIDFSDLVDAVHGVLDRR